MLVLVLTGSEKKPEMKNKKPREHFIKLAEQVEIVCRLLREIKR